jgi:uncharacterized protein YbjT (DUF2867 family)
MYRGVRHLLEACQQNNSTPHVVLVSQIYVTRSQHSMNAQGRLLDWRLRGEDAVRLSGLEYTIIRPSWLTHGHSAGEGVRLEQGDTGDGQVSIGDVATACLQGLFEPLASGKTFEIYNVAGRSPSWTELLRGLKSDSELMASAS